MLDGPFFEQQETDMNTQNVEINFLSDDELDAVAGGITDPPLMSPFPDGYINWMLVALAALVIAIIISLIALVARQRKLSGRQTRFGGSVSTMVTVWLQKATFVQLSIARQVRERMPHAFFCFLAPPSWATWTVIVGMIALVVGNVSLGALAGTAEALGTFLGRARRWAEIERLIRMKKRTRQALERFLVLIVALSLVAGTVPAWAGTACAIVADETASVRKSSLQAAITFIKDTFFDYVASMNCTSVVVVRLGPEPRFAKRTWLGPIPNRPEPLARLP
jgi:hypothetical protein